MAKKQTPKSTVTNTNKATTTAKKTEYKVATSSNFSISNKILIPAIILLFLVSAFIYCKPIIEGMSLSTHDSNQYIAMNKESADFKNATGHTATWSSRMFSGMPSFMIGGIEFAPFTKYLPIGLLHSIVRHIPDPAMEILFLLIASFIGFYVLTRRTLYAVLGAVAIGFCTANFVSLDAGHITKVITISMFMPLWASAFLILRQKKYIIGTILFLIFSFEIIAGRHVQIAYYSFMLIGIYIVYESIRLLLEKDIKHVLISGSIILASLAIAGMMNFDNYFINDFSKETTRGGDILNAAKMNPIADSATSTITANTKKEKGVGFDYATQWSFGYEELGSLFVPNFVGGSSAAGLDENSEVYKTLASKGVPPQQAAQFVQRMPLYWGSEPFVQGPIYLGAIVFFLFVFGAFAYKNKLKWWLIGSVVLCVLIALGKNFATFYQLLYNIVPMFNKFRAPTMILALAEVLMVILGVLGLMDFFDDTKTTKEQRMSVLKKSGGIVGGVLIFFIVLGSVFSFQSKAVENGKSTDDQFKEQLIQMTGSQDLSNAIYSALKSDRASLMRKDAIRSFVLVALVLVLLYLYSSSRLRNSSIVIVAIITLILLDFWQISKRYLNDNDFENKSEIAVNSFPETPADAAILAQNKDGARMVDLTGDIFNSASPVYFHRTIGGYNPAKLRRYQDVIEYGISYDFKLLNTGGFQQANFINMLNTRFLKQSTEANGVMQNPYALGNAWFVKSIEKVSTPEEEILKVREINPANTAIVNTEFDKYVSNFTPNADSVTDANTRFIKQVNTNDPMKLEYQFKSPKDEFVVFSEVIYRPNEDWISYIDGKPADHIRVNYILRGMKVNAGDHKITFEFKPKLYSMTNTVITLGNILFNVIIIGLLVYYFQRRKKLKPTAN